MLFYFIKLGCLGWLVGWLLWINFGLFEIVKASIKRPEWEINYVFYSFLILLSCKWNDNSKLEHSKLLNFKHKYNKPKMVNAPEGLNQVF